MDHSFRLVELEESPPKRAAQWYAICFVLGFLAMLGWDWYMRFDRYEWQNRLLDRPRRPAAERLDRPLFTTNHLAASRGGDLTDLIGIQSAIDRFAEERPAAIQIWDRHGFMNRPFEPDQAPDVVVLGDSFMAYGTIDTHFSSQLADRTGLFVLNHALAGHGPFIPVYRFLADERFWSQPPQVIVWGFAEREISGIYFQRFYRELQWRGRRREPEETADLTPAALPQRSRMRWNALKPQLLKDSLPDTSYIAQTGQWLWNRIRFLAFGQLNPWVVVADRDVLGTDMLFFEYHIETLLWPESERDAPRVAEVIAAFRDHCLSRGIELIVVLIPEKEQVYRDAIPRAVLPPSADIPPSVLWELTERLEAKSVNTVNLLPHFQAATEAGIWVYHRDDTHWNEKGIGIAADLVAERLTAPLAMQQGRASSPASAGLRRGTPSEP